MARYRYTINHPSLKGPARASDAPTKHVIEQLSSETPSIEQNPLPVKERLTSNEPNFLLILPSSCSQAERTSSTQLEPIPTTTPLPTTADHHEILVLAKSTKLPTVTSLMKQENAPGKVTSVKPESATLFAAGGRAMTPPQFKKDSSPPTCYLLKLPLNVRARIYGYLFGKLHRAVLGPGEAGELSVRFTKSSGVALCFTCRHIEEESRPLLYKHLRWVLEKDTPYVSLLSNPFHHTKSIRRVYICSHGNVQSLNSLAQHRAHFDSLKYVFVSTVGRVFTSEAPDRQPWTQLAISLKESWAGLRPEVWRAAKVLDIKNCKVEFYVECLYYPYMEGKKRDWHEKGGSWCSDWEINLNSGRVIRANNRPTQVISGIWPTTDFRFQGQGAARMKVFDEHQFVTKYAGQDGNPFKKL